MKAKTKVRLSFMLLDTLDLIEDFAFLASRPNMQRMSRYWGFTEMRSAYRAFERWRAEQLLEKMEQGEQALYRLGPAAKEFLQRWRPSAAERKRRWDGNWRMVVFDFPEVARKARDAFRRQLRLQHMGCLQKSVWITPDPVIPDWKRLLKETELTEWVLLFESAELGPVEDVDIARRVWSLDDLATRYERYVSEFRELPRLLQRASPSALAGELGREAQRECRTYTDLLQKDPLLPEALLPAVFRAFRADELHQEVRRSLRSCLFDSTR